MTLGFGLWLVDEAPWGYGYGQAWVIAAIVLWIVGTAIGALGAETARRRRSELAARLAAEGDAPSVELKHVCATHSHSSSATGRRGDPRGARDHGLEAGRMIVASLLRPDVRHPVLRPRRRRARPVRQRAGCDDPGLSPRSASRPLAQLRRVGFWTTLGLIVPAWIIMYCGGYWVLGHEGLDESDAGLGHAGARIADAAAVLDILLLVIGWLALRRPGSAPGWPDRYALPRRARGRLVLHVRQALAWGNPWFPHEPPPLHQPRSDSK